jgi:hypothetical protein
MAPPSPAKKLPPAVAVMLLLLAIVVTTRTLVDTCAAARLPSDVSTHAEMASVADGGTCWHLSGTYLGWCNIFNEYGCNLTCINEDWGNTGGGCNDFPPRCYCSRKCSP